MRIVLFIPCYNVQGSIARVLDRIPREVLEQVEAIWCVDNRSADGTLKAISDWVRSASPEVARKFAIFKNRENYSLGGSTIVAFKRAIEAGADFLVCMHSDGQADPGDLLAILRASQPDVDFVLGSRFLPGSRVGDYSILRRLGNLFFILLQRPLLGSSVRDIGAFISFNLRTVAQLPYSRLPSDMGYHPLLLLMAARTGFRSFREIPISWGKVETSHVNAFRYAWVHLWRLARFSGGLIPLSAKTPSDFLSDQLPHL